jgi:hypothetical protein
LSLGIFKSLTPELLRLQPKIALKPRLLPRQLKVLHVFILSDNIMPPVLHVLRAYLRIAILTMQVLQLVFMRNALLKVINVVSLIVVADFNRRHL